jgi:hypothetical protein
MAWSIKYNNGTSWNQWHVIEPPTNEPTITYISNRKITELYNGQTGRVIPTTKYKYDPVDLQWSFISGGSPLLHTIGSGLSLKSIVSGGYKVAFKTHDLSGTGTFETWSGYIQDFPKTYKLGMFKNQGNIYSEYYDVSVTIDLLGVG